MLTYTQYLEQHESLTGQVERLLGERDVARGEYGRIEQDYNAAPESERSATEPALKEAWATLQSREERLGDAERDLSRLELDHQSYEKQRADDNGRDAEPEPQPSPSLRERAGGWIENTVAAAGLATSLQVGVPPAIPPDHTIVTAPTREMPPKDDTNQIESLAKSPSEMKEEMENYRSESDRWNAMLDGAYADAPHRSADDITPPDPPIPPVPNESMTYRIENGAQFAPQPALPDPEPSATQIATTPSPAGGSQPRDNESHDR